MFKINNLIKSLIIGLMFITGIANANPPAESGTYVVRFEDWTIFLIEDRTRDLTAIIGIDVDEFCNQYFNPDLFSFKEVLVPNEMISHTQMIKGDNVRASVWTGVDLANCDPNSILIAKGTIDMVFHDNDSDGHTGNRTNANVWGLSGHGVMETPMGESKITNLQWLCNWRDPAAPNCKANIRLK